MKSIFSLLVLTLSFHAQAATFFVEKTKGVGADAQDLEVTEELIKTSINAMEGHQTTDVQKNATFTLKSKLLEIGESYLLTVEKLKNGTSVYSSQMKAEYLEDLDVIVKRLTRAVVTEKEIDSDAKMKDVTTTESKAMMRRKKAAQNWYFGFGPHVGSSLGSSGLMANVSIAFNWMIDAAVSLKIFWDGTYSTQASNDAGLSTFGLGGNYYFNDKDISPFITAEMGYGSATREAGSEDEKADSFVTSVGGGYRLFRTSQINLELLVKANLLLKTNSAGLPSTYGLRIGFYF